MTTTAVVQSVIYAIAGAIFHLATIKTLGGGPCEDETAQLLCVCREWASQSVVCCHLPEPVTACYPRKDIVSLVRTKYAHRPLSTCSPPLTIPQHQSQRLYGFPLSTVPTKAIHSAMLKPALPSRWYIESLEPIIRERIQLNEGLSRGSTLEDSYYISLLMSRLQAPNPSNLAARRANLAAHSMFVFLYV